MEKYRVIGLMSGTSLDGVDIAFSNFYYEGNWKFDLIHAETLAYSKEWEIRLKNLPSLSGEDLIRTNHEYGFYLGHIVNGILSRMNVRTDFIASHGHTVFHQPEKGFTYQIGDGNAIAAITRLPVVYDFRSADVALGGQGAPLVPIGDRLLFPDYACCLNLGGISNISLEDGGRRIAFDICPVNIVLNELASWKNQKYDDAGRMAASGKVIPSLINQLNHLDYYFQPPPKSLGREWIERFIFPLINQPGIPTEDLLRTYCEHIVLQITKIINRKSAGNVLVTGGGAKNDFLIARLREQSESEIIVPEIKIADYKEAIIFAFLGILRWRNEINCLASVTGASADSSGGVIVHPFSTRI